VIADRFLAGTVKFFAVAESNVLGGVDWVTRHGNDCERGESEAEAKARGGLNHRFINHPTTMERRLDRPNGCR
jgi:hypothetical protein